MDIIIRIEKVLVSISQIPNKDKQDIVELLDNNEWGIAFEVLCSTIEQENIIINKEQYKAIEEIGMVMKMDNTLWMRIKHIDN